MNALDPTHGPCAPNGESSGDTLTGADATPWAAASGSRLRRDRAFTLIEVMIAMALFSVILTAVYSSWTSILKGTKVGLDEAARVQRARMTMRTVVDSLLCVQMFAASPAYYAFVTDTKGDFASISFAAHLPAAFPDGGLYGDQAMRRITFTVEPGPNNHPQLVMYQVPLLADTSGNQEPMPVVLARDVSVFGLEFWDVRKGEWADEWLATNQLPKMVRVTLGTSTSNSRMVQPDDLVTRVVSIPAVIVPRDGGPGGAPGPGLPPNVPPGPGNLPGRPGSQPPPFRPGGR